MEQKLVQVTIQSNGVYFAYQLPKVKRGIRGKSKGKVDELLIVGVPIKKVESYCEREGLIITDKRVYVGNLDNPILSRKGNSLVYTEDQ